MSVACLLAHDLEMKKIKKECIMKQQVAALLSTAYRVR